MRDYLLIPGPTPLPQSVIQAMGRDMISHRGEEYGRLFGFILSHIKALFGTNEEVILFPASGTGGLEASIANLFSTSDKVLSLTCGHFGNRFAEIAKAYQLQVEKLDTPWGTSPDPQKLYEILKKDRSIKGVLVTHNETSTGVMVDLSQIGEVLKEFPQVLYIVDAVSSLGAAPIDQDKNGIDVVITASQKALMTPPGISLVSVSKKALERTKEAKLPRYYFDFNLALSYQRKEMPQNPYTPPVSLIYALCEAIKLIEKEGIDNRFRRHKVMRDMVRAGIRKLGFELVAKDDVASPTVTAFFVPEGEDKRFIKTFKEKYRITISGGQGIFKGRVIRIGHMGATTYSDLFYLISAFEEMSKGRPGVALSASQEVLIRSDNDV